jgi:hypothetical protein
MREIFIKYQVGSQKKKRGCLEGASPTKKHKSTLSSFLTLFF